MALQTQNSIRERTAGESDFLLGSHLLQTDLPPLELGREIFIQLLPGLEVIGKVDLLQHFIEFRAFRYLAEGVGELVGDGVGHPFRPYEGDRVGRDIFTPQFLQSRNIGEIGVPFVGHMDEEQSGHSLPHIGNMRPGSADEIRMLTQKGGDRLRAPPVGHMLELQAIAIKKIASKLGVHVEL